MEVYMVLTQINNEMVYHSEYDNEEKAVEVAKDLGNRTFTVVSKVVTAFTPI